VAAIDVTAAVDSAPELLDAVNRLEPDAVVADIRMPPGHTMEGIDAAHTIWAQRSAIGVVILSQYADPTYALALFENGTAGLAYLLKDRIGDSEEIVRALRAVVVGDSVIDPLVVEGLVARRARIAESPLRHLTRREADVLRAMAGGRTNAANRRHAGPLGIIGLQTRQLHLRQARPRRRGPGPPTGRRCPHVPLRPPGLTHPESPLGVRDERIAQSGSRPRARRVHEPRQSIRVPAELLTAGLVAGFRHAV
jgi:DNA-binding NarL/FixJ family response regulator